MGRPRLYHTPEEQKKARKRKDRNYYKRLVSLFAIQVSLPGYANHTTFLWVCRHRETILERSRNQYAERISQKHTPFEAAAPDNNEYAVPIF